MRLIKYVTLLCLLPFIGLAQSDEDLIKKTVADYLEGGTNGEVERFKSAFVSNAIQKSVGKNGEVIGMTVESLAFKIKPGTVMNRTTSLLSWTYAGIAATAITETVYPNSKIIDLLNLLKIGNEWKIVSRVYSRIESDENVNTSVGSTAKTTTSATKTTAKKKPVVVDDGW